MPGCTAGPGKSILWPGYHGSAWTAAEGLAGRRQPASNPARWRSGILPFHLSAQEAYHRPGTSTLRRRASIEERDMKLSTLIALAIVPCLALSAEAHSGYRHFRHHGSHYRHHLRYAGHHHFHHHHRFRADLPRAVQVGHDHSPAVPEGRARIYAMVTRSAIEHGLPPALAHGIVRVESGYNCGAYHSGASGIMQIKAASARSVGVSGGLRSCGAGLEAGMRYLRLAYQLAHGNASYAATLYNRGLAARPARSGYSRSVMRMSAL